MSCKVFLFALATLVLSTAALAKPAEHPHRGAPRTPAEDFQPRLRSKIPGPPLRPRPRAECTCDEPRLGRLERDLANLVGRLGAMETRSKDDRATMQNLQVSNRRQQAQISRVVGENDRLTRMTCSLRSRAATLEVDNSQLRDENDLLRTRRRDQPRHSAVDRRAGSPEEANSGPAADPRSSAVTDLRDVRGNREAEMMEMGVFPPVKPATPRGPERRPAGTTFSSAGPTSQLPNSQEIATSLLAMNQENEVLKIRIGELEGRMNLQDRDLSLAGPARAKPGPPPPPGQSPGELAEKISQLERLVLVALRGASSRLDGPGQVRGPASSVTELDLTGPAGPASRLVAAAAPSKPRVPDSPPMSDDDLEAMADVMDRVRNKSPAKSAFSVASTGIMVGAANDPRAVDFDHEYVNKGRDFDMDRNRFVCENPGFYYVTFTLRSYDGKYLGVALMKNEELQTAVYADSSERNVMQSQAVILHLEAGDELWLRHAPSEHFAVHSGQHRFVTFSGYLIYRGR